MTRPSAPFIRSGSTIFAVGARRRINPSFPVEGDVFQQHVKHPKVMHHFYGDSQAHRGAAARRHAPAHHPPGRAAASAAKRRALPAHRPARLHRQSRVSRHAARRRDQADACRRGDRRTARLLPRRHPASSRRACGRSGIEEEPTVRNLLAVALEARRRFPYQPALQILAVGRDALSARVRVHQRKGHHPRPRVSGEAGQPLRPAGLRAPALEARLDRRLQRGR